jgi:hypothetical protein
VCYVFFLSPFLFLSVLSSSSPFSSSSSSSLPPPPPCIHSHSAAASIRYNEYDLAAKVRHKALATRKIVPKIMTPAQFAVACYQCNPEVLL